MMPNIKLVQQWTTGQLYHPNHKKTCEYAKSMKVHAHGCFPDELIKERRPNESKEIHEFREKIFKSPTISTFGKIFNSLCKIRKASDYVIKFSDQVPANIATEETPEEYFGEYFPTYASLDNWFWSVCAQTMVVDSNALVMVMPLKFDVLQNEYLKPYPVIFESENIIDYNKDSWYFFKANEVVYFTEDKKQVQGKVYYYVDSTSYIRFVQTSVKEDYAATEYPHALGYVPVISLRGVVESDNNLYSLNRSRLHPALSWLDEAVREYSDLQASVLQSAFPTYWFYSTQKCGVCNGEGNVLNKDKMKIACKSCKGAGIMPFNPYQHVSLQLKSPKVGEQQLPTPPGGIIEKDTKVIEIQDKRIEDHLYRALQAVNMEHLDSAQLNQSGTAKEWDRSEGNNFVYTFGEDCVRVLDDIFRISIDIRYMTLVPDKKLRHELCPDIDVPVKFDISTDATMAADIERMRNAKFNASIIGAAEVEYAKRRFNTDQEVADMVELSYKLDGLQGQNDADITLAVTNGFIDKQTAIIHFNIRKFIEMAILERPDFSILEQKDQEDMIRKYADEMIANNSVQAKVLPLITGS